MFMYVNSHTHTFAHAHIHTQTRTHKYTNIHWYKSNKQSSYILCHSDWCTQFAGILCFSCLLRKYLILFMYNYMHKVLLKLLVLFMINIWVTLMFIQGNFVVLEIWWKIFRLWIIVFLKNTSTSYKFVISKVEQNPAYLIFFHKFPTFAKRKRRKKKLT